MPRAVCTAHVPLFLLFASATDGGPIAQRAISMMAPMTRIRHHLKALLCQLRARSPILVHCLSPSLIRPVFRAAPLPKLEGPGVLSTHQAIYPCCCVDRPACHTWRESIAPGGPGAPAVRSQRPGPLRAQPITWVVSFQLTMSMTDAWAGRCAGNAQARARWDRNVESEARELGAAC